MRCVVSSAEFKRVQSLPRRHPTPMGADEAAALYTRCYKAPNGKQHLRPLQGRALAELELCQGLFGAMAVGSGKTLVSFLAGSVLYAERALLLVPSSLRELTHQRMREASEHWQFIPPTIIGYGELSLPKSKDLLFALNPDLIICDEAHSLAHKSAARTKRFIRYFQAFPDTRFVALSGTMTKRDLTEYAHLMRLALGADAPMPMQWSDLSDWSKALQHKPDPTDPTDPGAIHTLCQIEGCEHVRTLSHARESYRSRLADSHGVILTTETSAPQSIHLRHKTIAVPQPVRDHLSQLEAQWVTPSGVALNDSLAMYRAARQLCLGYEYIWSVPPPHDWQLARATWSAFVREKTKYSKTYDSEKLVADAVIDGKLGKEAERILIDWQHQSYHYKPHTVPIWHTTKILEQAQHGDLTDYLIWVDSNAVGEKLEELSGFPYYGGGADALEIKSLIDTTHAPIILSIQAHSTGKNMQSRHKNLVITPPSSGAAWEQLLGRTHRPGQESDTIEVEVLTHLGPFTDALENAFESARYIESTTGQTQKLLLADVTIDN